MPDSSTGYPALGAGAAGGSASGYGGGGLVYGGSSAGGSTASSAALNRAAGYQSSGGSNAGSTVLKKRAPAEVAELESRSLSKRTPGGPGFLAVAGSAMFFGTLAGNLFVSSKQKNKPVPLVTPNADTRGPMIIGGDKYTEFLEYKRKQEAEASGTSGLGGGSLPAGVPASAVPATVGGGYGAGFGGGYGGGGSPYTTGAGGGVAAAPDPGVGSGGVDPAVSDNETPVLKKRSVAGEPETLGRRAPLWPGLFAGTASADASTLASSLSTKTSLITGAASGLRSASTLGSGLSRYAGSASTLARGGGMAASEAAEAAIPRFANGASGLARTYSGVATGAGGLSRGAGGLTRGPGLTRASSDISRGAGGFSRSSLGTTSQVYNPMWGNARPATLGELQAMRNGGQPATIEALAGRPAGVNQGLAGGGTRASYTSIEDELEAAAEPLAKKPLKSATALEALSQGAGATMTFNGAG